MTNVIEMGIKSFLISVVFGPPCGLSPVRAKPLPEPVLTSVLSTRIDSGHSRGYQAEK